MSQIKIIPSSILNAPLQNYAKDFTFIVNGKEFRTSRVFSDMISRKISQMHFEDPTIDTYTINTRHSGDFSHFLSLCSFREVTIPEKESDFLIELIEELGGESIEIVGSRPNEEITLDNALEILRVQSHFPAYYSESIEREIDFISKNFFQLFETKKGQIIELPKDVISRIVSNKELLLESEDDLIELVNELYLKDSEFSVLYESVEFDKVSTESIAHFIEIFDYSELTSITWYNLTRRLQGELKNKPKSCRHKKCQPFIAEISNEGDGLLSLLRKKEKSPFDRLFVASQSTNDAYNLIDANTRDSFALSDIGEFIEIELQEPVCVTGVKIYSAMGDFPKTFDIEINGDQVISIKKASKLNGANRSMLVCFGAEKCKKVRLVNRGPNWDNGDNYINIKRIELVSSDAKYESGVFSTLVSMSENNDPHKCPVKMTASFYDLNTFCSLDSLSTISTYNDKNSWFQIEFTQGSAVVDGFRLRRFDNNKMRNYKIICTDDANKALDEWTTLIDVKENERYEHKILDIYEFSKQSPPSKYIRLVQTGPNWDEALSLVFIHFDLFGEYLA